MTLLIICVGAAVADEYGIPWYSVDGGAGVSTGGDYVLSGIIGQPDAGELTGGVYVVKGGFWVPAISGPSCTPSATPEHDTLPLAGDPINQKMRYLSFKIAEAGRQQGIRVTMVNLPAPYDTWNGTVMFVGPPTTYCENSGKKLPPCPSALPTITFQASTLECELPTVENGMIRDWTAEGVVHVYHEGIIPGGTYYIEAADSSCPMISEASWSDPLIATTSKWGDLVRSCAPCPCTPPDGVVNMASDVTAVLDKFRNLEPPDVNCASVTKARADHDWEIPDQLINISDATCCLDAFRGVPYPPPSFAPPSSAPCGE